MAPVDLQRSVPLHRCAREDVSLSVWSPGAVRATKRGGEVAGYHIGCPGCGVPLWVGIGGGGDLDAPGFRLVSSDPSDIASLTIDPGVAHRAEGGCGWLGRVYRGEAIAVQPDGCSMSRIDLCRSRLADVEDALAGSAALDGPGIVETLVQAIADLADEVEDLAESVRPRGVVSV